jgi:hypothetical protein
MKKIKAKGVLELSCTYQVPTPFQIVGRFGFLGK